MSACPFCEGKDLIVAEQKAQDTRDQLYWIECLNPLCGAEGPIRETAVLAAQAWDQAPRPDSTGTCHHLEYCESCNPRLKERT